MFSPVKVKVELVPDEEGKRSTKLVSYVERKSSLARLKIADALSKGQLTCEACLRTPLEAYGAAGNRTLEVHHKTPVAIGIRNTKMTDLAILCCNCHAALHALGDELFDIFIERFR